MPARQHQVAIRRQKIADLLVKNCAIAEIARKLELAESTVYKDAKVIEKQWLESVSIEFSERLAREAAKLDRMEAEAWEAWERSKSPEVEESTDTEPSESGKGRHKVKKRTTKKRHSNGNVHYLYVVDRCIEKRMRLFRLAEPEDDGSNIFESDIPIVPVVVTSREELGEVLRMSEVRKVIDAKGVKK